MKDVEDKMCYSFLSKISEKFSIQKLARFCLSKFAVDVLKVIHTSAIAEECDISCQGNCSF